MTMLLMLATAAQLPLLDLSCRLEPEKSAMKIEAFVTYAPAAGVTDKAVFFLSDRMNAPQVDIVAPENLKGEVVPKQTNLRDHDATYEIQLPGKLQKEEKLKVRFTYTNKDAKGFVYMLSPKVCLAGGYNTCWFPSVGNSRRMLGKMSFESPSGFIVKASGKEMSANETGGTRTTKFQILQPTVPTFAAARYKVTRVEGAVPMTVYFLRERPTSQAFADGCSKILSVLTREFGPYPFPDFSIIETPSPESSLELGFSGASFEGFMFADSSSLDSGFNTAYFGHEMGHQWWGNLVQRRGEKGAYMLSEGLAQFGSLQCVEEIDGPLLATKYRTTGFPGYSWLQSGYGAIQYTVTKEDRALSDLPSGNDTVYHQFANSKGFLAWDAIARQIGRDRFRKGLRSVTSKYAWGSVSYEEVLDAIRSAGGPKTASIVAQWLDRKGLPIVSCDWSQGKSGLALTLRQSEPAYSLVLPVVVEFADGSSATRELAFDTASKTYSLPAKQRVTAVRVDPNHQVLHSTPDLQKRAEAMKPLTEATFLRFRGDLPLAISTLQRGVEQLKQPDVYGAGFLIRTALANIYRTQRKFAEAKAEYELAINCPVRDSAALPYAYFNYGRVLWELGDKKSAEIAMQNAEVADALLPRGTGVMGEIVAFRTTSGK